MGLLRSIYQALYHARTPIITIALVYFVSVLVGISMVNSGNEFALSTRDRIVGSAQNSSILVSYDSGNRLGAAFLDFGSDLLLGGFFSSSAMIRLSFFSIFSSYVCSLNGGDSPRFL